MTDQATVPDDPTQPNATQPAAPPSIWIGLVPISLISIAALIASIRVWHWWPLG